MLLPGPAAGCGERQVIYHPGLEPDDGGTSVGDGESLVDREGNFPEPALSVCGALPDGVDPIPGLATAWAVSGTVPGNDLEGLPLPDDGVRLRFADYAAACDEPFGELVESETCVDAWAFALSLAVPELGVGVYDLPTLAGLYPEIQASVGSPDGCAGGGIGGGGGAPNAEISGELEIFSVTDACIVGELRGLEDVSGDLDIDRNGGFVAMRCHSDCVPMLTNDCGQ